MLNSRNKSIVGLLLLSVFLLFRVSSAHALSHFEDDQDNTQCELCELIITSQDLTPVVEQDSFETETITPIFVQTNSVNTGYIVPLHCIVCPSFVHNKPPPIQ